MLRDILLNLNSNLNYSKPTLSSDKSSTNAGKFLVNPPPTISLSQDSQNLLNAGSIHPDWLDLKSGIKMVQTATKQITKIADLLTEMQRIALQASCGTYSPNELARLDTEFQQYKIEIDHIANSANFNGLHLLNDALSSINVRVAHGMGPEDFINISLTNLTTGAAGLNISNLNLSSQINSQQASEQLNNLTAISKSLGYFRHMEGVLRSYETQMNGIYTKPTATRLPEFS